MCYFTGENNFFVDWIMFPCRSRVMSLFQRTAKRKNVCMRRPYNGSEQKRSKKQRRKGNTYPFECRFPKNSKFSSVQSLSNFWLFVTPWITACQVSLSTTNSQSSLKLMSIKLVMPSSHLIICHLFLLLPTILPSIRVFSNESTLRMRWPKYWSFSFSISPSNEQPGLISFRMDWLNLLAI